jgi:hypothetical protein
MMTSSGEDAALFERAMASAGFKAMVVGTPAVAHLLRTGAMNLLEAVPVMTAAAAQQAAGPLSVGCAKQAECSCPRCTAEDDSAQHGVLCSCLACLPADRAAVDATLKQQVEAYLARDASISFVDCDGGAQVGIQSATGQWLALRSVLVDTGASVSIGDYDMLLGLGLTVKPVQNLQLRIVAPVAQTVEGVVSTRLVFKPGTRHELVVPVQVLALKGLGSLASLLLGRVEQHRIAAVLDTREQVMRYMPKLHLGRMYHASIPLVCHKSSQLQQQLRELVGGAASLDGMAKWSVSGAGPSMPLVAAAVAVPDRYEVFVYHDDAMVRDTATGACVTLQLPPVLVQLWRQGRRQLVRCIVMQLMTSGDVELNPGPSFEHVSSYAREASEARIVRSVLGYLHYWRSAGVLRLSRMVAGCVIVELDGEVFWVGLMELAEELRAHSAGLAMAGDAPALPPAAALRQLFTRCCASRLLDRLVSEGVLQPVERTWPPVTPVVSGANGRRHVDLTVAARLLRSGDVEQNPGPELGMGDLLPLWAPSCFGVSGVLGWDFFSLGMGGRFMLRMFVFSCSVYMYTVRALHVCWVVAAVVIRLRLVQSGDVELNPGPATREAWQGFMQRVSGTFRPQFVVTHWAGGERVPHFCAASCSSYRRAAAGQHSC